MLQAIAYIFFVNNISNHLYTLYFICSACQEKNIEPNRWREAINNVKYSSSKS